MLAEYNLLWLSKSLFLSPFLILFPTWLKSFQSIVESCFFTQSLRHIQKFTVNKWWFMCDINSPLFSIVWPFLWRLDLDVVLHFIVIPTSFPFCFNDQLSKSTVGKPLIYTCFFLIVCNQIFCLILLPHLLYNIFNIFSLDFSHAMIY